MTTFIHAKKIWNPTQILRFLTLHWFHLSNTTSTTNLRLSVTVLPLYPGTKRQQALIFACMSFLVSNLPSDVRRVITRISFPHQTAREACLHCDNSLLQMVPIDHVLKERGSVERRSGPALGICEVTTVSSTTT